MRVKELKNLLNQIPDETEVLLRCQTHEKVGPRVNETETIMSITPNIGETEKYILLNTTRAVRLATFLPQDTAMVNCKTCVRKQRIEICKSRNKSCAECLAVCECKQCGNQDIECDDIFANKPKYEKNLNLH